MDVAAVLTLLLTPDLDRRGRVWTVVYVWCPRDIAEERLTARNLEDVEDRLRAWDQTLPLENPELTINTAHAVPDAAAQEIHLLF
jgi:guanylate kinase